MQGPQCKNLDPIIQAKFQPSSILEASFLLVYQLAACSEGVFFCIPVRFYLFMNFYKLMILESSCSNLCDALVQRAFLLVRNRSKLIRHDQKRSKTDSFRVFLFKFSSRKVSQKLPNFTHLHTGAVHPNLFSCPLITCTGPLPSPT